MVEQIVVGIDGSNASFEAFEQALVVARALGSAIKCVFVVDSRKTQVPIIYTGSSFDASQERIYLPLDPSLKQYYLKIADDLHAFAKNCTENCIQRCEKAGLRASSAIREGYPTVEICDECRSADLLVIGQKGENAHFKRSIVGSTTEDLVRTSPRPIVIVPTRRPAIKRVLYAYDGGRSSENALRFFVSSMKELADEFVLFDMTEPGAGDDASREIDYLALHGIQARIVRRDEPQPLSIFDAARREDADLIVTGAHGKHKIKAYLLGANAAHLIRKSTVPVLVVV